MIISRVYLLYLICHFRVPPPVAVNISHQKRFQATASRNRSVGEKQQSMIIAGPLAYMLAVPLNQCALNPESVTMYHARGGMGGGGVGGPLLVRPIAFL